MPLSTRTMCCLSLSHLSVWKWEKKIEYWTEIQHFSDVYWFEIVKGEITRTGLRLPRPALWRCFCWWSQRWCWRNAGEEAVGVYNRTLRESSRGTALPQEGPLWRRPEHTGCCFPWTVAKLKRKKGISQARKNTHLFLKSSINRIIKIKID